MIIYGQVHGRWHDAEQPLAEPSKKRRKSQKWVFHERTPGEGKVCQRCGKAKPHEQFIGKMGQEVGTCMQCRVYYALHDKR